MRTTLSISDDVLQAARQIADITGQPLGDVVSDLARRSLDRGSVGAVRNGVQLLPPSGAGSQATLEEVNELREDLR